MTITKTTNPQYDENTKYWQKADDVYNDRIKAKGKTYLPGSNLPTDLNGCSELYQYLENKYNTETLPMAVFYNFSNLTLSALIGAIMRKPPTYKFAEEGKDSVLNYLIDNADGKGNGLTQVARMLLTSQYLKSRGGLLISSPQLTNLADLQSGKVAPRLVRYDADKILDWETSYVDGQEVLTYLLLCEKESKLDGSGRYDSERLISFTRDNEGVYYEIEVDGITTETDYVVKGGEIAQTIPFHLASAVNNDWCVDPSPMRTLIELNLLHYIMMSRDMQGRYDLAQLQLSIDVGEKPTAIEDFNQLNPNGVMSGSSVPILTAGGKVEFLQANESNLLSKAPDEIENKAVKAGAQLFEDGGSSETATAAEIRASNSTATMATVASNAGDCIYNAIVDLAGYLEGVNVEVDTEEIEFALNTEFFGVKLDAQQLQAYTAMVQQGVLPLRALYEILRKSGDLAEDMTFEDYQNEIRETTGMGGMPDVSGVEE